MSKKVLIISSSPRKNGNSDVLCDQFVKGAKESGNDVEKIFLNDKDINYCTGCGYCNNNRGVCAQKDSMQEMQRKMVSADVIVFATPIYFYTMAGQMKTFIDRNCAFYTELNTHYRTQKNSDWLLCSRRFGKVIISHQVSFSSSV